MRCQFFASNVHFDSHTKAIWDRQVNNFWEINWVIGTPSPQDDDSTWLDQRKNWRSHFPLEKDEPALEGGDLCVLMGRFQEISGTGSGGGADAQAEFYDALREVRYGHSDERYENSKDGRRLHAINIGATERLCAIALIKRLFPLVNKLEGVMGGWRPGAAATGNTSPSSIGPRSAMSRPCRG